MGKLIIPIILILISSCSAPEESLSALDYLKATQNEDGSWGEKNKIYCTSYSLLTYYSSGESVISAEYGNNVKKGTQYLLDVEKLSSKEDLDLYFWALSESYNFTGSSIIEKTLIRKIPEFKQSLNWNYTDSPENFFVQVQALHSYRSSGIGQNFRDFLTKFKSLEEPDSLVITTLKRQWGIKQPLSDKLKQKIKFSVNNDNPSFIHDMMLGRYLFLISEHKNRKVFESKINKYRNNQHKYQFDSHFSEKEFFLMNKIAPRLIDGFCFPIRYLPSSHAIFPDDEKEGVNLVE